MSNLICGDGENGLGQGPEGDMFVAAGQHEPVTTRLSNILQGYTPDTIWRETLQNADDARAWQTELILDLPENNFGCQSLLTEEMGPL